MKKTFAKALALLLTAVMMLSLAACGGTAGSSAEPAGESAAPAESAASSETASSEAASSETASSAEAPAETEPAGTEIGLLDPYPETVTVSFSRCLDQVSTYQERVTNDNNGWIHYIKDELNIECVTAFEAKSGEDYDRQTSLAIASEELPDFLYIYGNGSGSGLSLVKELYENDLIMPLNEVYEKYASERMKDNYESYGEGGVIFNDVTYDGNFYALPYCAGSYYPMVWIRADWLRQLGITLDEDENGIITRDDLVMVAKAFKEADFGGNGSTVGLALPSSIVNDGMNTLTDAFGAYTINYVKNEDGTVIHGSTDPRMKEALAWLRDLYAEGILDPQYGTRTGEDINELLINGQLGIFTGPWSFGSTKKSIHEMDPNADFVSYNIDNGSGKVNFPATLISKDQFFVISKKCEHPEALFKIYEFQSRYSSDMTAAEREAACPELYGQQGAGMTGQARPCWIDLLNCYFCYNNQINPTLSYVADGTVIGTFDPETNSYYRAYRTYHEDPTTMDSADWVLYVSRFGGGAYHAYKLAQAGLYEMSYPIYNQVPAMADTPVDLKGMMEEYFIKIITGELPLDAFDDYVEERNRLADAEICRQLAEAVS